MNIHQTNLMRGMMLIGGELVPSESGEWLGSVNPANEELLPAFAVRVTTDRAA